MDAAYDTDHKGWEAGCKAISAVSTVPWVLLSAGVDFDVFSEQARIASSAGASGWLAGRAIWKEVTKMGPANRTTFLKDVAIPRAEKLAAIAKQYSRPWTDFYAPPVSSDKWFIEFLRRWLPNVWWRGAACCAPVIPADCAEKIDCRDSLLAVRRS